MHWNNRATQIVKKARAVKKANDAKRLKASIKKIKKADSIVEKSKDSVTQVCRQVGISVDKYYRIKKNLKS